MRGLLDRLEKTGDNNHSSNKNKESLKRSYV